MSRGWCSPFSSSERTIGLPCADRPIEQCAERVRLRAVWVLDVERVGDFRRSGCGAFSAGHGVLNVEGSSACWENWVKRHCLVLRSGVAESDSALVFIDPCTHCSGSRCARAPLLGRPTALGLRASAVSAAVLRQRHAATPRFSCRIRVRRRRADMRRP